jgi:hypothetical protein
MVLVWNIAKSYHKSMCIAWCRHTEIIRN